MRNELLKELRLEDLSGSSLELAEAIGMEGFIRLVDNYEGTSNLYVPKASELIRPVRDELIRREYNGKNVIALARKYSLTDRSIREIVKDKAAQLREEERKERLDGQRSLIDAEKQDVLQWVMVGGEGFLKPAPDGTGRLAYHVVRRDCYNVLARGPRGITDVLMSERSRAGSDYYTLLERRTVDGSGYLTIRYNLYVSENSSTLGHEVRLDSLPQYAALAPEHTYSVPFGGLGMTYIRLPMANNVDGSPDGVSVYEGAVQLIHNIYKNEYQLGREFELGRSRIVANADKLVTPDPEGGVMRLKDDVFVGLDGDTNDKGLTIFSPALRDESFERRKQSYLKACENIIGLKRGILSDVEAVERTAKEISSSEGDYSLSIMDLQRMWYDALLETLRITDLWGQALGLCDAQAVDLEQLLSVSWGNGVLYDADKDWADTLSMVEAGLLKPELALAKKYDLPCETPEDLAAIREKYMPEMVQLTAQAGLR